MYNSHIIKDDEHRLWFADMLVDDSKQYFIFEMEGDPKGVVGFYNISSDRTRADWAFYSGDPSVKGVGSMMEAAALKYAFENLKVEKLNCEVIEFNMPVVKLHRRFGFQRHPISGGLPRPAWPTEGSPS